MCDLEVHSLISPFPLRFKNSLASAAESMSPCRAHKDSWCLPVRAARAPSGYCYAKASALGACSVQIVTMSQRTEITGK